MPIHSCRSIEDWLTVIAAGQAVGIPAEATAAQHPARASSTGVRDAPPVPVWLAWWADSPPRNLDALVQLVCEQYGRRTPEVP